MAGGSFVATVVVWVTLLGRASDNRTVDKNIFTWIPEDNVSARAMARALRGHPVKGAFSLQEHTAAGAAGRTMCSAGGLVRGPEA